MNRQYNIIGCFSFNHYPQFRTLAYPNNPRRHRRRGPIPSCGAVEPPIAGLAEELEKTNLTSSVEPLSSAVLKVGSWENSTTDGGDDKLVEPIKMKKPWDAFPKFTVNRLHKVQK